MRYAVNLKVQLYKHTPLPWKDLLRPTLEDFVGFEPAVLSDS